MSNAVIDAARQHWALGDSPVTLVAARENQVYRVDGPIGPCALRLHRPGYRTNEEIHSELQWMAMLTDNGIAAPAPIAGADASFLQTFEGTTVSLLSWIDGTPHSKIAVTAQMYFELGRVLAQMHTAADQWKPPPGFTRPTWDLVGNQPTWDRFWENPLLTKEQRQRFVSFRDDARGALESLGSPDFGLIHADLVPDNILSGNGNTNDNDNDNGNIWVIDFDDGGFGHRVFDLATITLRSRRLFGTNEFADAAITGYCDSRALDKQFLTLFEALRACTYVGWNISRMNETGGIERNARFIDQAQDAISSLYKR